MEIKRYEITEVMPDAHIVEAMDKQAAAERERRKAVSGGGGGGWSVIEFDGACAGAGGGRGQAHAGAEIGRAEDPIIQ